MNIEKLTSIIANLENAVTELETLNKNDVDILLSITKIKMIQHDLIIKRNNQIDSFDRKTELKKLLEIVLKNECIGLNSAIECLKDSDMEKLLNRQFDNGFYSLSNGDRIGKDFRIVLYHYLQA